MAGGRSPGSTARAFLTVCQVPFPLSSIPIRTCFASWFWTPAHGFPIIPKRPSGSIERHAMHEKTKLIGIFYIIFGAMGLLGLPMIYVQKKLMGALFANLGSYGGDAQYWIAFAQELVRLLVPVLILLIVLHVLVNVLVGICFIKYKAYWSCVVASVATCLFFPLGTVLGVFALMALIEEETKKKFGVPPSQPRRKFSPP